MLNPIMFEGWMANGIAPGGQVRWADGWLNTWAAACARVALTLLRNS
jgi:hypothetical protein